MFTLSNDTIRGMNNQASQEQTRKQGTLAQELAELDLTPDELQAFDLVRQVSAIDEYKCELPSSELPHLTGDDYKEWNRRIISLLHHAGVSACSSFVEEEIVEEHRKKYHGEQWLQEDIGKDTLYDFIDYTGGISSLVYDMNEAFFTSRKGKQLLQEQADRLRQREKYMIDGDSSSIPVISDSELADTPRSPELIEGMFPQVGVGMLFGGSGSGKTFAALKLALCVASGQDFMGHRVMQGPVFYVCGEGGKEDLNMRVQAWKRAHNRRSTVDSFKSTSVAIQVANSGKALRKALDNIIKEERAKPRLMVIDTLRVCLGTLDENDNSAMAAWVLEVRKLAVEYGMLILLVHHIGKSDQDEPRGAQSLRDNMDTVVLMRTTNAEKRIGYLKWLKQRASGELPKLYYQLQVQTPASSDVNPSCCLMPYTPSEKEHNEEKAAKQQETKERTEKDKTFLLSLLETHGPQPYTKLLDLACDEGEPTDKRYTVSSERAFNKARKELEAEKKIEKGKDKLYRIVTDVPSVEVTL